MPQTMYLLRGLPGSGKSTWAQAFAKKCHSTTIVSADAFHIDPDGVYRYKPHEANASHAKCIAWAIRAATELRGDHIIVDNTNIEAWRVIPYAALAASRHMPVVVVEWVCKNSADLEDLYARQVHAVPHEIMYQMWAKWSTSALVATELRRRGIFDARFMSPADATAITG